MNEYINEVWVKANVIERRNEVNRTFAIGGNHDFAA